MHIQSDLTSESLAAELRDYVNHFRLVGLQLDRTPTAASYIFDDPFLKPLAFLGISAEYNLSPLKISKANVTKLTTTLQAAIVEELAYGDVTVLMALPGPSLSGAIVEQLGNPQQKDRFFSYFAQWPAWSCFAVTEPQVGADATELSAKLHLYGEDSPDLKLIGEKWFIGSGSRASIGVVLARNGEGALSIRAAIVDNFEQKSIQRSVMPTVGLRGAELSGIVFDSHIVAKENILGTHLSPVHAGLEGALQVFHRHRPCVAAMAIGMSRQAFDLIRDWGLESRSEGAFRLQGLKSKMLALRKLLYRATKRLDASPRDSALTAVVKWRAVELLDHVRAFIEEFAAPGALLDQPELNKWWRDSLAFEYMEGPTNTHLINSFQSYKVGHIGRNL